MSLLRGCKYEVQWNGLPVEVVGGKRARALRIVMTHRREDRISLQASIELEWRLRQCLPWRYKCVDDLCEFEPQ
jgi:hypothetical protein